MADQVTDVSDAQFEAEVLQSDLPVMVDMWAPWCGPCRMVGPVVEELAGQNADKLKTCKMNVDENPETAGKLGITAIPTVVFFKGGREVQDVRLVGVQSKGAYQKAIDKVVAG